YRAAGQIGASAALLAVATILGAAEGAEALAPKAPTGGGAPRGAGARASGIHGVLDPRAARSRTTAVTGTAQGTRVVASSVGRLTPGQRAALGPGEVEGVGVGHAEVIGVQAAQEMGLTPTAVGASRPICPACAEFLGRFGIKPVSPLK